MQMHSSDPEVEGPPTSGDHMGLGFRVEGLGFRV